MFFKAVNNEETNEEKDKNQLKKITILTYRMIVSKNGEGAYECELHYNFVKLCKTATTLDEIYDLVDVFRSLYRAESSVYRIYNMLIGWALPSKEVCDIVYATYQNQIKQHPDARLIDLGAGSGIFSHIFHQKGIPSNKIVALDLKDPAYSWETQRHFWKITVNNKYKFKPNDILFVAWGGNGIEEEVDRYCKSGGTLVIILGTKGNFNLHPNYFKYNPSLGLKRTEIHKVIGSPHDHLSVNVMELDSDAYEKREIMLDSGALEEMKADFSEEPLRHAIDHLENYCCQNKQLW